MDFAICVLVAVPSLILLVWLQRRGHCKGLRMRRYRLGLYIFAHLLIQALKISHHFIASRLWRLA